MANEEQLAILKQGVEVWNDWREKNPNVLIHLVGLLRNDFWGANLSGIQLYDAGLSGVQLINANLSGANFNKADLSGTHLSKADLREARFAKTNLTMAQLDEANLMAAEFDWADMRAANLRRADLSRAYLRFANLWGANLMGSKFLNAEVGYTIFGKSDLSEAMGLEGVVHDGPSSISVDTFVLSKGKIPEAFLRGCGLSDWEIEMVKLYNPDLSNEERNKILYKVYDLQASQAIQISPVFISYSHGDGTFVNKLENQLNKEGIRFWRDIHDATSGRLEKQIDRAIRQNPTVLLILSSNSIKSDWVEHEVRTARALEKDMGWDVLCPIALDDSWKDSRWPKRVMEQIMEYNILDFSAWEDDSKFEDMFRKLIDGLDLFYKG